LSLDVTPPRIYVIDQQMHHKVASVNLIIETLEQE